MTPKEVVSFCRICNAMCGIVVTVDDGRVVRVRGDEDHALSRGYCCPKGRAIGAFHHSDERLDAPEIAVGSPVDGMRNHIATSWDELHDSVAGLVRASIEAEGADSIAMYLASGSAFDTNGRRAAERFFTSIGSRQKYTATTIDTPCKPLVAELMAGWSGLTPVWDSEGSTLLLLIGTNPIVSHGHSNAIPDPVRRLRDFRGRGGVLITVDPRTTETAAASDLHLRIEPGTDHVLLAHLVREVLAVGGRIEEIRSRAEGVDLLAQCVHPFDAELTSERTGIPPEQLANVVAQVHRAGRLSALTGTGSSMSAVANVTEWLLWALHIVTDSADRPGGMWFNPGYLSQLDRRDWVSSSGEAGPGPASRPDLPRRFGEYPCAGLVSEIEAGAIRVLFVVGGNPALALPETARTAAALASLDALIVIDIVRTETTRLATHLVPAAGQLERADLTLLLDTYQLAVATQQSPAVLPVGADRRPVWSFFAEVGERLGLSVLPRGVDLVDATDEVLLGSITARSRTDTGTVSASPSGHLVSGAVFGWVHERVLPAGRWRLAPESLVAQFRGLAEHPSRLGSTSDPSELRLRLLPQRRLRTMNSQLRTVAAQGGRTERPTVVLSPSDAGSIGVGDGELVLLESAAGSTVGPVEVSAAMPTGSVGVPHGWTGPDVSSLTSPVDDIDELTGMVLQSGLVVSVRRSQEQAAPSTSTIGAGDGSRTRVSDLEGRRSSH